MSREPRIAVTCDGRPECKSRIIGESQLIATEVARALGWDCVCVDGEWTDICPADQPEEP